MNKQNQTPPPQEEERKKKKRKKFLILLFVVIGFFVFGGTGLGIALKMRESYVWTSPTRLDVVIDPIIATGNGETHINGAQRFTFGETTDPKAYNTHIEARISYGQQIYYDYLLTNNGTTDVGIKLDLDVEQKNNATITYCVNDGEIKLAEQNILDCLSNPNNTIHLKVFIRINDPNEDAYVKGVLILSLTEEGVEDD